jgi:hypothetical protein
LDAGDKERLDRFAASALEGIMANPERWKQIASDYEAGKKTYEECSRSNAVKAYSLAKEMMTVRKLVHAGRELK